MSLELDWGLAENADDRGFLAVFPQAVVVRGVRDGTKRRRAQALRSPA
jgi:hypothetical protein